MRTGQGAFIARLGEPACAIRRILDGDGWRAAAEGLRGGYTQALALHNRTRAPQMAEAEPERDIAEAT